jgi:outer membrane lipopolysaccharide assembly protein LptE/RlpB
VKNQILRTLFLLSLAGIALPAAATEAKIMALDFQLNDMTNLPNAPEELARISHLSATFKQKLTDNGVQLVPVTKELQAELKANSATYFYERVEVAAKMAQGSGADYLLIAVALKPTYLFVYPRILMVDLKTEKVVLSKASQLESSWLDKSTTARSGENLADMVSKRLDELAASAN